MFARVVIDKPALGLTQIFTYRVPPDLADEIRRGQLALIPFGSRFEMGFVESLSESPDDSFDEGKIKDIEDIIGTDTLLSESDFALAEWIANEYMASLSESIRLLLPPGGITKIKRVICADSNHALPDEHDKVRSLLESGGGMITETLLRAELDRQEQRAIHRLIKEGLLKEEFRFSGPKVDVKTKLAAELIDDAFPPVSAPAQKRVWDELNRRRGPILVSELIRQAQTSRSTITAMEKAGLLKLEQKIIERAPLFDYYENDLKSYELSEEQNSAIEAITEALYQRVFAEFLIQGVTGSGKTEVYLSIAESVHRDGGSAIILVPEISLTPQMVSRFNNRFPGEVAVLHSNMGLGERFDQWRGVKDGRYKIIIGPRSAVFAPVRDLRVIIVDEEHEGSYKQNTDPRYNARDVARKRAELNGSVLVLGSATPSLETRYRVDSGEISMVSMPWRPMRSIYEQLPEVEVVDLCSPEAIEPGKTLSNILVDEIRYSMGRDRKALIFLNRRGFARFVICGSCGHVETCENCNVSMTYHRPAGKVHSLHCHHCDAVRPLPDICPECGQAHLGRGGVAIQQVEAELRFRFPDCRLIRMDADTVGKKGAHARLLDDFRKSKNAILLGTQMIAKGLDFPDIDLVGVIDADVALNMPDFRASERCFQMMLQVSGRAGRSTERGKVIIQTRNPKHPAIALAVEGAYELFNEYEIEQRRELDYPPFSRLINIIATSVEDVGARKAIDEVHMILSPLMAKCDVDILGPAPAPISKIRNRYRYHLIIKVKNNPREAFGSLRAVHDKIKRVSAGTKANIIVDVDPYWLL